MDLLTTTGRKSRIVLTTFGSLGDLHPYLALALSLQDRGHDAVIATSESYRQKVEALGIGFRAVRPDHPDRQADPDLMRRLMDRRRGPEVVLRKWIMPALRETYDDLLAAVEGADLLLSHPITYATRLVAERKGIPWASSMLAPLGFISAYDPPVLPSAALFGKLRFLGPAFYRPLFGLVKRTIRSWSEPWRRLRAEIGLPPSAEDPIFEGQHSPALVLALFSKLLADKQPDWPSQTVITGFPFYEEEGGAGLATELARFLDAGPPPIVFTLGSSAVMTAGRFYEHSAAAAQRLGRRAVLLIGKDPRNRLALLPDGVAAFEYAPFAELFPRAAAVVHQGGVGTTGQAMRSGRPMLVMPYAHDQPDNAERVRRLGIARTISRDGYTPARAAAELRQLLENPAYAERAAEIGRRVHSEDGVCAACDAIERVLSTVASGARGSVG
jgi:rhamnosyltransferase subunit B